MWLNISSVLLVFSVAIISPGPNFLLVINRSLYESRQSGLYTAFGVATGSGIFALVGMLGLLLVVDTLPYFATLVQIVGGSYLVFLGLSILFGGRRAVRRAGSSTPQRKPLNAYANGLATNLTNPKAWAFYLSLFTLVIDGSFPLWAKFFLILSMFLISLAWYSSMAILLSDARLQSRFLRAQPLFNAMLGILIIFIGGKLLASI